MFKVVFMAFMIVAPLLYANNDTIEVVTENYAPFQWSENQKITGPSTDVVKTLLQKVGNPYTISVYPWARTYKIAQSGKNVLIYSISRTKEREKLFKWVGTIAEHKVFFWKLKSKKNITIKALTDAKAYVIAGVRKDAKTQYLMANGFKKNKEIGIVHSTDIAIRLLYANRVDIIVENEDLIPQVKKLGYDSSMLEKVYYLKNFTNKLNIAFSLGTSNELVQKYIDELRKLKQNGEFEKILGKYKIHD